MRVALVAAISFAADHTPGRGRQLSGARQKAALSAILGLPVSCAVVPGQGRGRPRKQQLSTVRSTIFCYYPKAPVGITELYQLIVLKWALVLLLRCGAKRLR